MKILLEFLRFMFSFAVITAEGGFPERFINLCNKDKINLWDVSFDKNKLKAKIYCKDFLKLKTIRRRCGVKLKIEEKHGLRYLLKQHKKRSLLLTGILSALIFMYTFNQFVWFIEVSGAKELNATEIISSARNIGLDIGTFAPDFNQNEAGRKIVNLFDGEILWAAVNIKGSKAVIEIRENNINTQEKVTASSPSNFVADFDGVITSSETYSGTSMISLGSAVKKGDILISGISENTDGSVSFIKSDGKISAMHNKALNYSYTYEKTMPSLKLEDRYKVLNVFSFTVPLSYKFFYNKSSYQYNSFLSIDNIIYPFDVTYICNAIQNDKSDINFQLILAIDEFTALEYNAMKNTKIMNADYKSEVKNEVISFTAEYECVDFIGKKIDILKEN